MSRILIVDDDLAMVSVLAQACHEIGFATIAYHTAEEVLAHLREDAPALIICDLRIGEASGLDILRVSREALPDTPVVVITAFGSETVRRQAVALGAASFLVKPFKIQTLQNEISRHLNVATLTTESTGDPLAELKTQLANLAIQVADIGLKLRNLSK